MSNAVVSRLGQVNGANDANALFLKVWSGEVLATFMRENKMLGMTNVRSISSGKSAQFPVIGTTSASYHTPGNEILGSSVNHAERTVNIDDLLVSSAFLANIDEAKNHYDVRSIYTSEMGRALANTVDKNLLQLAVLASRESSTISGGNGGLSHIDADANILVEGSLITSELGNILVFAKYKISKFNKNEKEILTFNSNEKNLIFDIINKETIKLILENK